jgi:hypothetical protein
MSDERAPNSLPLRRARNTTGHVVRKRSTTTYGPARTTYGPASGPAPGIPAEPVRGPGSPPLNGDADLGQTPTWGSAWPQRYTPMPPPQVPPAPSAPPGQYSVNGAAQSFPPTYQPPADPRFPVPRPASQSQPVIRSGRITGRPGVHPGAFRDDQAFPSIPSRSSNSIPLRPGQAGAVTSLQHSAAVNDQSPRSPAVSNSVPLGSSGGPVIRPGRLTGAPAAAVRPGQSTQLPQPAQPRPSATPPPQWAAPRVALPVPAGGLLGSSTVQLAGRALRRYAHSIWLPAELFFVGMLFFVAFRSTFDTTYFFGTANFGLGLLSILGTYILAQRVMPARMYVRRALREGRRPRVGGLLLASSILRVSYFLLLLALALVFQRMPIFDPSALAVGALGLLANCVLIAAITLALTSPIATQLKRVVFLAWLVAALYSYSYGDRLAVVLAFARVPLMPFSLTYALSVTGQIGSDGLLGLLVELAYIGALVFLADYWLAGRLGEKMARRTPVPA